MVNAERKMTIKSLLLNIRWTLGYRAVFSKEPSDQALVLYAKMGRAVATRHCAVCRKEYWVIGNPKVKGHVSLTCSRRDCYVKFHTDKLKYTHTNKTKPKLVFKEG